MRKILSGDPWANLPLRKKENERKSGRMAFYMTPGYNSIRFPGKDLDLFC